VRGFPRYVDAVTGEPVWYREPGAVFDHVAVPVSRAGSPYTTWVPIPPNEVRDIDHTINYELADSVNWDRITREAEEIRAKEAAAKKAGKVRPTTKQKVPGVTETYRNAGDAADLFLGQNWHFIESLGYLGAEDQIRAFLDGFEVRRGRARKDGTYAYKRLVDTKKGREIVDAFASTDEEGAREFLVWLFSQNRGKRWREVDWSAVDGLGDVLATTCGEEKQRTQNEELACTGWVWYPPAAGLRPLAERLQDLTPKAQRQLENQEYSGQLKTYVRELRAAFKKGKSCLPAQSQEVVKRRIAYLNKLAKEPWRVEFATICGPDPESGHQFCGFPAIAAEVAQLRKACEFGYDPNWPLAEALSVRGAEELGLPASVATGDPRPADIEGTPITLDELDSIPWQTTENPEGKKPPPPGTLDDDGRRMLWSVYESAKKHYRKQGERGARLKQLAARVAWSEVRRHYFKRGGKWHRRKHVLARNPDALDLRQAPLALRRKGGSKPKRTSSSPRRTRSNPKPRNPYGELLDLRARVVELEIETKDGRVQVHTWHKDRPALFWSEKRRALVWVHGGRDPSGFTDAPTRGAVASRHRKWHGAEPSEVGAVELPSGALSKLGPALRIVYFAERYRDGRPRHHDFGAGVAAYAQKSRGARVFEVRGGRLTLNDRGLVF